MKDKEFRMMLARLTAQVSINDAIVMSNPKKYLLEMREHCNSLLKVLDDVDRALSPDIVFDFWDENCDKKQIPRPIDIQGEALIRCNAALKVLREYRYGK